MSTIGPSTATERDKHLSQENRKVFADVTIGVDEVLAAEGDGKIVSIQVLSEQAV